MQWSQLLYSAEVKIISAFSDIDSWGPSKSNFLTFNFVFPFAVLRILESSSYGVHVPQIYFKKIVFGKQMN